MHTSRSRWMALLVWVGMTVLLTVPLQAQSLVTITPNPAPPGATVTISAVRGATLYSCNVQTDTPYYFTSISSNSPAYITIPYSATSGTQYVLTCASYVYGSATAAPFSPVVIIVGEGQSQTDQDDDGVPDNEDLCPRVYAPETPDGCPWGTDTDGDGIPNTEDRCPQLVGNAANGGCPGDAPITITDTPVPPSVTLPTFPADGVCYVATNQNAAVNIRREPSTSAEVVGRLDPLQLYEAIATSDQPDGRWYQLAGGGYVAEYASRQSTACDSLGGEIVPVQTEEVVETPDPAVYDPALAEPPTLIDFTPLLPIDQAFNACPQLVADARRLPAPLLTYLVSLSKPEFGGTSEGACAELDAALADLVFGPPPLVELIPEEKRAALMDNCPTQFTAWLNRLDAAQGLDSDIFPDLLDRSVEQVCAPNGDDQGIWFDPPLSIELFSAEVAFFAQTECGLPEEFAAGIGRQFSFELPALIPPETFYNATSLESVCGFFRVMSSLGDLSQTEQTFLQTFNGFCPAQSFNAMNFILMGRLNNVALGNLDTTAFSDCDLAPEIEGLAISPEVAARDGGIPLSLNTCPDLATQLIGHSELSPGELALLLYHPEACHVTAAYLTSGELPDDFTLPIVGTCTPSETLTLFETGDPAQPFRLLPADPAPIVTLIDGTPITEGASWSLKLLGAEAARYGLCNGFDPSFWPAPVDTEFGRACYGYYWDFLDLREPILWTGDYPEGIGVDVRVFADVPQADGSMQRYLEATSNGQVWRQTDGGWQAVAWSYLTGFESMNSVAFAAYLTDYPAELGATFVPAINVNGGAWGDDSFISMSGPYFAPLPDSFCQTGVRPTAEDLGGTSAAPMMLYDEEDAMLPFASTLPLEGVDLLNPGGLPPEVLDNLIPGLAEKLADILAGTTTPQICTQFEVDFSTGATPRDVSIWLATGYDDGSAESVPLTPKFSTVIPPNTTQRLRVVARVPDYSADPIRSIYGGAGAFFDVTWTTINLNSVDDAECGDTPRFTVDGVSADTTVTSIRPACYGFGAGLQNIGASPSVFRVRLTASGGAAGTTDVITDYFDFTIMPGDPPLAYQFVAAITTSPDRIIDAELSFDATLIDNSGYSVARVPDSECGIDSTPGPGETSSETDSETGETSAESGPEPTVVPTEAPTDAPTATPASSDSPDDAGGFGGGGEEEPVPLFSSKTDDSSNYKTPTAPVVNDPGATHTGVTLPDLTGKNKQFALDETSTLNGRKNANGVFVAFDQTPTDTLGLLNGLNPEFASISFKSTGVFEAGDGQASDLFSLSAGEIEDLLRDSPEIEELPALSPDAHLVAYLQTADGVRSLRILNRARGASLTLFTDGDAGLTLHYSRPVWLDEDTLLFTLIESNGFAGLYLLNVGEEDAHPRSFIPNAGSPTLEPEGRFIAFRRDVNGIGNIFTASLVDPKTVIPFAASPPEQFCDGPSFGDDKATLFFLCGKNDRLMLYRYDSNGVAHIDTQRFVESVSGGPAEGFLAYDDGATIYLTTFDGRLNAPLIAFDVLFASGLSWAR